MTYHLERRSVRFGLLFTHHKQFKRQIWGLVRRKTLPGIKCVCCGADIYQPDKRYVYMFRPIGLVPNKTARICQPCGETAPVREAPDQP